MLPTDEKNDTPAPTAFGDDTAPHQALPSEDAISSRLRRLAEKKEYTKTRPDDTADDIPEPPLPLSMTAALQEQHIAEHGVDPNTPAGQVTITVDQALYNITTHVATVMTSVEKSWAAKLATLNVQQEAIATLAEVLRFYAPVVPYGAQISVLSPMGFPIVLTVQERSQEAFMAAMGTMMTFLQDNGFTAQAVIPF